MKYLQKYIRGMKEAFIEREPFDVRFSESIDDMNFATFVNYIIVLTICAVAILNVV